MKQLVYPSSVLIGGPSQGGKTVFMTNLIKQRSRLIDSKWPIKSVLWFSPTTILNKITDVTYFQRLPIMNDLKKKKGEAKMIIIDDYLSDLRGEAGKEIIRIVLNGTHHLDVCVCILVQNMFEKQLRTISLNCQYLVIFKSPRDTTQIQYLLRQIFGKDCQDHVRAVKNALALPYSYVLLDLSQSCPEITRIRTDILEGPREFSKIYMPKNGLLNLST